MNSKPRVAVVTGANRGIGFEVWRQLARRGIHVIASRSPGEATLRNGSAFALLGGYLHLQREASHENRNPENMHVISINKPSYAPTAIYCAYKNYIAAVTSVHRSDSSIPLQFQLFQNYPNPFNPSTTIHFSLPQRSHVTLKVFVVLGREVATLVDGEMNAGEHSVVLDAMDLPSGVYLFRIQVGSYTESKKLILVK
jgi:hypothetical protein